MSKSKSHRIETQALNLACSYLEDRIGCPKEINLYNCNYECHHNDNLYGDECWRTYLRMVAKDDINEDDKTKKKEIILNDLQVGKNTLYDVLPIEKTANEDCFKLAEETNKNIFNKMCNTFKVPKDLL